MVFLKKCKGKSKRNKSRRFVHAAWVLGGFIIFALIAVATTIISDSGININNNVFNDSGLYVNKVNYQNNTQSTIWRTYVNESNTLIIEYISP